VKLLSAVAVLAALVHDAHPVAACATAPPRGEEARIADEEALIAWDAATKTETFIRRAAFRSTAKTFGFLVPTPTKPELGEAPDDLFEKLAYLIRPEIKIDHSGTRLAFGSLLETCAGSKVADEASGGRAPAVRVIQSAHVAGMDATTLEADDPKALADWLGAHGFDATPALTAWLERYVTDHWKITAFVVGTDEKQGTRFETATKAVKLTFTADQPFYPYREPTQPAKTKLDLPPRMLRVFFASDQRYTGRLGDQAWNASTLWSGTLDLPTAPSMKIGTRLTVFIDEAAARIGDAEVTFVPFSDQSDVKQPPVVVHQPHEIWIPVEGIVLVVVLAIIVIVRRRRKRR
jgi:hypothetical protein